jgi:hypothetical protein
MSMCIFQRYIYCFINDFEYVLKSEFLNFILDLNFKFVEKRD